MACSISLYSAGESRVEMNLPRFSLSGSVGRPTFGISLIKSFPFTSYQESTNGKSRNQCYKNANWNPFSSGVDYYKLRCNGVCIHFSPFFLSGGNGVLSNAFKASSNLTPLRFGNITGSGRFLCFARFDFDTYSLSAPRNMRGFWFYKAVLQAAKPVPSNCLPIG